ncbi:hypothetical protein FOA52_010495 [Chlamydomonas sp. UWO 241]|nr:hypothetical protein FOA52_010495 [Chlamydomonas sp. UWO 241]
MGRCRGYAKLEGSATCDICDIGYGRARTSVPCTPCDADYYKDSTGDGLCTDCPDGSNTNSLIGQTACTCTEDYKVWDAGQAKCVCKTNYYSTTGFGNECNQCPAGSTAAAGAVATVGSCTCTATHSALVSDGGSNTCKCDAGYTGDATTGLANACTACGTDSFKTSPGSDACNSCASCTAASAQVLSVGGNTFTVGTFLGTRALTDFTFDAQPAVTGAMGGAWVSGGQPRSAVVVPHGDASKWILATCEGSLKMVAFQVSITVIGTDSIVTIRQTAAKYENTSTCTTGNLTTIFNVASKWNSATRVELAQHSQDEGYRISTLQMRIKLVGFHSLAALPDRHTAMMTRWSHAMAGSYLSTACSATADTECTLCTQPTSCPPGQTPTGTCTPYATTMLCVDCAAGKFKAGTGVGKCSTCTSTCSSGSYLTGTCGPTTNPTCALCTTSCGAGKYLTGACTATTNNECLDCVKPVCAPATPHPSGTCSSDSLTMACVECVENSQCNGDKGKDVCKMSDGPKQNTCVECTESRAAACLPAVL